MRAFLVRLGDRHKSQYVYFLLLFRISASLWKEKKWMALKYNFVTRKKKKNKLKINDPLLSSLTIQVQTLIRELPFNMGEGGYECDVRDHATFS